MANVAIDAPFASYKGTQNFVFVSYAHIDGPSVFPVLTYLHEQGYRIWYDEGIDPGNEWPEEIARALADAAYFLVFLSSHATASHNVRNEINFAIARQKPFLAVYIEDSPLPVGLELQMGSIQALMRYRMSEQSFRQRLSSVLPQALQMTEREMQLRASEAPSQPGPRKHTAPPFLPRGLLQMMAGWALAWVISSALRIETVRGVTAGWSFPWERWSIDAAATLGGATGGLATALSLSRHGRPLAMRQSASIVVAWVLSWALTYRIADDLAIGVLTPIGATVTVLVLKRVGCAVPIGHMLWIIGLWVVGSVSGMFVVAGFFVFGEPSLVVRYLLWALAGGIMGLVGGLPTLYWSRRT